MSLARKARADAVQQVGLRQLVQQRFLDDIFESSSKKWPGWKVLIVDGHAMRIISSVVGMYDIMERRITLVESIEKKRAPFPDMGAIYLLEPTVDSINKLLADYTEGKSLYGDSVFLFFLGRISDELLNKIKGCKTLLKRLKALSEINIDFLAKEERAYTLEMRSSFASFYAGKAVKPAEGKIADKMVTVCATLNEYPHIRYKNSSSVCSSLAAVFHHKMEEFMAQNPSWWFHGGPAKKSSAPSQRDRGSLLLLDRADDCLTPLMHDFTYQPMVHDLLEMDGDRITFESKSANDPTQTEAKDVLLDERDDVWVELRGKHIAKVIETLSNRIRDVMDSSTGSTLGKKGGAKGNMSLSQMAAALKALPEYREAMSKLSQHMHIAHECMDMLTKQGLVELSELEQTLATGKDEDGGKPKLSDLIDQAEELIKKTKLRKDRLRLILICIISQGGLREEDRTRLVDAADLMDKEKKILRCLEVMGLTLTAPAEKNTLGSLFSGRGRVKEGHQSDDDAEYTSCRYVPAFKSVLEEFANEDLSLDEYPSVLPMPEAPRKTAAGTAKNKVADVSSARKSTAGPSDRWSKSVAGAAAEAQRSMGPTSFFGGRCLVFVVGGMSYPELRAAREVMESSAREIVMGSTAWISAEQFMDDLEKLSFDEDESEVGLV